MTHRLLVTGSRHCIDAAQRAGIPPRVLVHDYTGEGP